MKYLLDTSIYSQPLKKHPQTGVINRWKAVGDNSCCISVFCELEVLQGIKLSQSDFLQRMYTHVLKNRLPILPFTYHEAKIYADLQAEQIRSGTMRPVIDLCIAATSIAHSCTLVTLNHKDFSGIAGLSCEVWN
ncbi:MAG: type II toxin-antitoxin system VapC family toxin [Spirochaetales bacterium]|nr:type II toxin-antitoxin system VapC family toxin [Spirochaetales bacterium]MCF7937899.1 type II toxin-antitoxin system VapC family toxin [Spirochaetales bacterium]